MSDPIGAGIEGLTSGFLGGFGLRENIRERRRRAQLASDLATLKAMEEQRKAAHEAAEEARARNVEQRAATTFAGQQADLARARALREAVGQRLGAGDVDIPAEGVLHGVATGQAPRYVPLPRELEETRVRGQLLGGQTEPEQLALGSDPTLARTIPRTPGHYFVDEQGRVTYTAAGAPGHRVEGVRGVPQREPAARAGAGGPAGPNPLNPAERRAARQVVNAVRQMRDLYRKDPTAAQTPRTAAALQGAGHLPFGIGSAVSGVTGPMAQARLTANQQAFQRAATQLRHHYVGLLPHSRTSLGLLHDVNTALVPPAGTDPTAIEQSFAPEWETILRQLEPFADPDVAPGTVPPATPAPGPTPTAPASPSSTAPAAGRPTWNAKFWKPKP